MWANHFVFVSRLKLSAFNPSCSFLKNSNNFIWRICRCISATVFLSKSL